MDMQTYYEQFENCLQEEKPFCADDCPFQMDVLDFQNKIANKRYSAAYKVFRNAVAFPDIVAALCPQNCTHRCPRRDIDGAIQLNTLERTCIAETKRKDPNEYNLPPRKGKIAIIGAGLSGLSCALRLATKKYEVVVYEKDSVIGGLLNRLLPREFFMEDIERQFQYESYTLHTDTEITDIHALSSEGFDVIYIATGENGDDFGVLSCESASEGKYCFLMEDTAAACHKSTAVFAGGSLLGKELMYAAADGLRMAREIEGFIKTGIIRYPETPAKTEITVSAGHITPCLPVTPTLMTEPTAAPPVTPTAAPAETNSWTEPPTATPPDSRGESLIGGKIFTADEAAEEAARCIRCQCNSCMTVCDLTDYFNKWPLQMRDEIMTTTMPANSMIRKAPAIRLINMCTQCGLCSETCPGQIELGGMIKEARRVMHKIDRMPGAYHQFWVRDMEFANGKYAALAKCPPGKASCRYAFFPGCHLGAANPLYVKKAYEALLEAEVDTGLLLRCCGVPADWAGNEEMHEQEIASLRTDWEALGKPTMIMACPSCMRHFREYLPEIPMISLYEVMDDRKISVASGNSCEAGEYEKSVQDSPQEEAIYSVFDPCAARNCDKMQDAVRNLLSASKTAYEELPDGDKHGCCGFGGNIEVASPKLAEKIAEKRSSLSEYPYITYCINCRDVFYDDGKPVKHILDILLDIPSPTGALPTVTERRCNRVILKEELLKEIWGEEMREKPEPSYELIIAPEIKAKMNALKILEEDICHVLEMGEIHGRRTLYPQTGTYKCYREIGRITCWVEYKPCNGGYEIHNVYTHRMKIELEVVFNGRKTDADLR